MKTKSPEVTRKKGRKRDWGKAFLEAFRLMGVVAPAATHAGVSRWAVRKRCERDPEFAEAYANALEDSTERMESIAIARATQAKDPSDTLLIFMLKARRPSVYRDNHRVELGGADGKPVTPVAAGAVILLPQDGFEEAARRYANGQAPDDPAQPGTSVGVPG